MAASIHASPNGLSHILTLELERMEPKIIDKALEMASELIAEQYIKENVDRLRQTDMMALVAAEVAKLLVARLELKAEPLEGSSRSAY